MPIRVRYILKCLFFLITDRLARKRHISEVSNELLIVHTDAIGDYILFRNFIEAIKQSHKFKHYNITLLGNQAYKDFAEHFDKNIVNEFIWLNRSKFGHNYKYRQRFLKELQNKRYNLIINPSYSRDFIFGDSIVRVAKGESKVGQIADLANSYKFFTHISNKWYSELIDTDKTTIFEFYRNKSFCETVIEQKTSIDKPFITIHEEAKSVKPYILLFPGAGEKQKQWSVTNFADCADWIKSKYNIDSIVTGSTQEKNLGESIQKLAKISLVSNECGRNSLVELVRLIKGATLLISNDSSAVHIAACTNTPTICVGNGRHFSRFTPYPNNVASQLHFVFPTIIHQMALTNVYKLQKATKNHAIASINDIKIEDVILICDQLLQSK